MADAICLLTPFVTPFVVVPLHPKLKPFVWIEQAASKNDDMQLLITVTFSLGFWLVMLSIKKSRVLLQLICPDYSLDFKTMQIKHIFFTRD